MIDEDRPLAGHASSQTTSLTTAHDRLNPQALWVERVENESQLTQKKIEALEKTLKTFMEAQSMESPLKRDPEKNILEKDFSFDLEGNQPSRVEGNRYLSPSPAILPPLDFREPSSRETEGSGLRKVVLNLRPSLAKNQKERAPEAVENTLPANTYATAVILGGVDASTSIQAASDPRPVLLRILDKGSLPRRFKSDLKNCRVSASAYGDLSSERVFMRLEKLTCVERLTGETVQTQVAGYILGEDGRAGVRGVVADRAGEVLRQSLMGGFLSGMSQFFGAQQQRSVFPVSPFGQTKALSADQMVGSSLSQGTGNALEKYADFFIKRAEQLQPVLQVAAGRKVDIVFTEGTRLGDTSVRKAIERARQASRSEAVHSFEKAGADSQNWLPPTTGDQS